MLYKQIDRNAMPNEVVENLELYKKATVGWMGKIKGHFPHFSGDAVLLLVEHRYYNWIEYIEGQDIKFILSNTGAGDYTTRYDTTEVQKTSDNILNGTIKYIIVYGKPDSLDYMSDAETDESYTHIFIEAEYIRFIDESSIYFTDDIYEENLIETEKQESVTEIPPEISEANEAKPQQTATREKPVAGKYVLFLVITICLIAGILCFLIDKKKKDRK